MKPKIQARIPNAMFLEIERAARHELISIADFVRAALLEKLNGSETKMKPNNKSLFDCSLMRIQSNNQSASAKAIEGATPRWGVRVSRDPVNFWMEQKRRAASKKMKRCRTALL
jgi:hypothetical protein